MRMGKYMGKEHRILDAISNSHCGNVSHQVQNLLDWISAGESQDRTSESWSNIVCVVYRVLKVNKYWYARTHLFVLHNTFGCMKRGLAMADC